MLTFRETPKQSNSSDVLTSVTAGKKQRKKRSKKKKNANLRVSDGASDSSDSDEEDNFQIEVADMKPAEFHLLGAVISDPNDNSTMQLAQSIAFRMSIGKEEVIKCIEWMWDRGLKYDDEESVEKCIREQTYISNSQSIEVDSSIISSNQHMDNVITGAETITLENSIIFPDVSNVIERLNIVASYAVVNLYDTLVAICSWATLFDEKKEGISKATVFFASECLDKIMEALIGNPLIWESKLEIQTALESLFVHLILEKTVLQKVIDSVVYLLRLLLQRNSNVSSLAEIQQVKIAKQFAEAVRIILHDFVENSPQPELQDQLKTLQNEILALKNQSDPKAMFQLRELYLDLTHLSSIQAQKYINTKSQQSAKDSNNAKQQLLQQIGRANFAIQNQIEGLTVEKAKLHSQAINQAKKENEKLSGIILKEKEELLRKVREARNKKSQLSYQLQLCEQEIRSLDERLNLVNQRGSEIDLMREQSHSKQRPQSGKTSSENFNSFHIDESEKIVDHAQRYLVEHILRGTDGSNTLIDPAQEAIDKIRESQNVYIENEIKCIMFVVLRLQKMKSKVVQWRKDLEVYKKLHLQKLVQEIDHQLAQAMIEIREDKATAEQLLEYLESTCKSWGISGTEHQISGFVDLIAVVQIEEILVPAPYFSTSQPLFRQAVLGKIQELSWKPMEPTVGHPLAPNINGNIQVKRDNQPAKKIPNSQSNNRDSKKKGVDKSRKDTPTVKGADTMKTIEAIEKITANKVNQPRSAPTVAIAHVQTNPKTNSFLDIQKEQTNQSKDNI